MGGERSGVSFRILAIDRTKGNALAVREHAVGLTFETAQQMLIQLGAAAKGEIRFNPSVAAILGFIRLPTLYLVVANKKRDIGAVCGNSIYMVQQPRLIPVASPSQPPSAQETETKALLLSFLRRDFYFSHSLDLSQPMQVSCCRC